jgi:hypothetical protein
VAVASPRTTSIADANDLPHTEDSGSLSEINLWSRKLILIRLHTRRFGASASCDSSRSVGTFTTSFALLTVWSPTNTITACEAAFNARHRDPNLLLSSSRQHHSRLHPYLCSNPSCSLTTRHTAPRGASSNAKITAIHPQPSTWISA